MKTELPALGYAYHALEPYMDEETVRIHHDKHHAKYVNKFKEAIEGTDLENKTFEEIFANMSQHTSAVAHNGGQAFNHGLFWLCLSPKSDKKPSGELADVIDDSFGSFETFKEKFSNAATTQFGSGWAWLIKQENGKLVISSTSNHVNPLMDIAETQGKPILCIDVWEHAYYLKYQNRRPDFIEAFWNIVNWAEVAELYK